MSEEDSGRNECKGVGPKSPIIRHYRKALNPPESWQEENRKWWKEKD
ncbi:MAG: hypothetical protein ABEJ07_01745 [Candidatus Nanohaloarchaea archaeon]